MSIDTIIASLNTIQATLDKQDESRRLLYQLRERMLIEQECLVAGKAYEDIEFIIDSPLGCHVVNGNYVYGLHFKDGTDVYIRCPILHFGKP